MHNTRHSNRRNNMIPMIGKTHRHNNRHNHMPNNKQNNPHDNNHKHRHNNTHNKGIRICIIQGIIRILGILICIIICNSKKA